MRETPQKHDAYLHTATNAESEIGSPLTPENFNTFKTTARNAADS